MATQPSSEVQCKHFRVWYPRGSLNGQAVLAGKDCLECLYVEVLSSPISWRSRRAYSSADEFEEMTGLSLQDLPGGMWDGD